MSENIWIRCWCSEEFQNELEWSDHALAVHKMVVADLKYARCLRDIEGEPK